MSKDGKEKRDWWALAMSALSTTLWMAALVGLAYFLTMQAASPAVVWVGRVGSL